MSIRKGFLLFCAVLLLTAGCGSSQDTADADSGDAKSESSKSGSSSEDKVASADEMADPVSVDTEGLEPVSADMLRDGEYEISVDSSSSMFNVKKCTLTVKDGKLTAAMTMGGTGYLYVYMGTGEEAASASEDDYIPYVENEQGEHTFVVPVESLNQELSCAAFSKKKEKWYDRTLVFRGDSLPAESLADGVMATAESFGLEDGIYQVSVVLEGGSGKASVESPAELTIKDKKAAARLVWSSANYDYMIVNGEKYLTVNEEGNSVFEIPVDGFDWKLPVKADTTAMSEAHEIDYTLQFDSASIEKVK